MSAKRNPYIRIVEAAKRGEGVRLTADEVFYVAQDSAIETVVANTEGGEESRTATFRVTKRGFEDIHVPS